jgi:DNA-binding CsgD family transcriptional regulator
LERERALERLERAISAAVDGVGSVVAIEGEAGIGKTSLVGYATGCGSSAGMRVLRARGGELEREFAFGVVRQLFEVLLASATGQDRDRWLAGAAGLSAPVLSSVAVGDGVGQEPTSVLHGLYWLSANLSVEQPLLIAVDDAQWADTASIRFLSYLAPRVPELAVVVVYASRVGEGASSALPAVAEPEVVSTVLRPAVLSEPAVALLIEQLLDRPSSQQFTRACHVATGGNPFLVHELLRALEGDDVVPDDASVTRVEDIAPTTIALATLARLRRLGRAANDLACALAVLGRSAELRHAAALAQQDDVVAVHAADVLTAAGVVRDGRPLEFIHPIVRTTVYNALAPANRAASHKRAARLLAQDGVVDVALAPHLLATEPSSDRWVVERLRAAAREVLERGAPDAACTYLERATREPAPPSDRLALLLALGSAELQVGKPAALARLQVVLKGASDVQTRLAAAQELVWALVYAGRVRDAVELCTEVVAGVSPDDQELALRLEAGLVSVAQFAPAYARPVIDRLAPYEDRLRGETSGERQVLACLAFRAAHRSGSAPKTAALALLALSDGNLLHDHHQSRSPAYFLAVLALLYADWLDEAERYFDLAIEEARKRGFAADAGGAAGCRCHVLVRQGRLAQAEADALSTLAANDPHPTARVTLLSCVLLTMTERSDARATEPFLAEHALDGDLSGAPMSDLLLFCRGQLRLACGDAAAALHDFQELRRLQALSGLDTPAIPSRACQALAHLQLGDRDVARALAEEELQRARRWNTPSALAFALRTAGLVEGGARGIELLEESAASVEQSPATYERARCLTELGAALRRAGQRRAALQRLREGLDLADRCGALRLARRARDELVALGARPRRAALSGRDALTPSERRIAQLAADGLSNRDIAQTLFVTLRTVEGHLTHTYMKLDITSRQQLAHAMATSTQ